MIVSGWLTPYHWESHDAGLLGRPGFPITALTMVPVWSP